MNLTKPFSFNQTFDTYRKTWDFYSISTETINNYDQSGQVLILNKTDRKYYFVATTINENQNEYI